MPAAAGFLASADTAHKARLANYHEAEILAIIGASIGTRYPLGTASRWYKAARSLPERCLAEGVAGLIFEVSRDDPLSRRVAIIAATAAAKHEQASLVELIRAGFDAAFGEIDRDAAFVAERLAAVEAMRTRERLAEIAAARAPLLAEARSIEREIAGIRRDIECGRHCDPAERPAHRYAAKWCTNRDIPRLEKRLVELRAATPAYRLSAAKRRQREVLAARLRRLRAAARALRRTRRDLGRRPAPRKAA